MRHTLVIVALALVDTGLAMLCGEALRRMAARDSRDGRTSRTRTMRML